MCIIKEGRKNGETIWDGRDGRWRVRNEAKALKSLGKLAPHFPCVYDQFDASGNSYLVIEKFEGVDLDFLIRKKWEDLAAATLLKIAINLCEIVATIHQMGWVWRDCKTRNFVVVRNGDVKAIDFEGACRKSQRDIYPWSTPLFTPPEWRSKAARRPSLAPSFDLFGLGVCLSQLFTGSQPGLDEVPPIQKMDRIAANVNPTIARLLDPDPSARPEAWIVAESLRGG
jgi:serine/threonine protein kinase